MPAAIGRLVAVASVIGAAVVLAVVLLGGGGAYEVRAVFADAGQLVRGAEVQVGGRAVGKVKALRLTRDFQAEAVLDLRSDEVRPLREGTTAAIRAVSLSGVTNRFVELHPGAPSAPALPDGAVLGPERTQPIVDLDTVLDSLDPETLRRLRRLIGESAQVLDGTAPDANRALRYLPAAVSQGGDFAAEASRDTRAVGRLVTTGAAVARIVAQRAPAVEAGVADTATTLEALARNRAALADGLARLPGVLRQANGTFRRTRAALAQARPALRDLRPVAGPLAGVLRRLAPVSRQALPAVRGLNALLPGLRRGLDGVPALGRVADPALRSTASAVHAGRHVFSGLRQYGPDVLLGTLFGVGGTTTANYDANGHFARFSTVFGVEGTDGIAGLLPQLAAQAGTGRTGADARCPGAAVPSAPDGSNPWQPDPSLCDLGQSVK